MIVKFTPECWNFLNTHTFEHFDMARVLELLMDSNIIIYNPDEHQNYDVLITNTYEYNGHKLSFGDSCDITTPVIYLAREDGASVYAPLLLRYPQIIGYIKDYNLIDMALNNAPYNKNNYHLYLTDPTHKAVETDRHIHNSLYHKVETSCWNMNQYSPHGKQFKSYYTNTNTLKRPPKTIDVFSGFHVRPNSMDGKHRMTLYNKLERMQLGHEDYNIVVRHDIPGDEFMEYMRSAKIFIAPYGMGERTASDYFAIYNHCILIKPYSGYVDSSYKFYDAMNRYYIPCRTDYADLDTIIDNIMNNYDYYYQMYVSNTLAYLYDYDRDDYIRDLCKSLNKCYNRYLSNDKLYNYDHLPKVIDPMRTIHMLAYSPVSNILVTLSDLDYMLKNPDDQISISLNNTIRTKSSRYFICLPNMFVLQNQYTCVDTIENKDHNDQYTRYFTKFINKINYFEQFNDYVFMSSNFATPHHMRNITDEQTTMLSPEYFELVRHIIKNRRIITIAHGTYRKLLDDIPVADNIVVPKDYYNNIDKYTSLFNDYNYTNVDIAIVMLDKFSYIASVAISQHIQTIDCGRLMMLYKYIS